METSFSRVLKIKSASASAFLAGAALLLSPGCATFWCGTGDTVRIDSMPSSAEVFVNGESAGSTPCEIDMDGQAPQYVVLKSDGYANTRVRIRRETSKTLALNYLMTIFALGGLLVDSRAGAEATYSETDVIVPLLLPEEEQLSLYGGNVLLTNVSKEKRD
ncbi:MAG: PEGA domain-containing protein [Candidatus Spyradosoma sp.]